MSGAVRVMDAPGGAVYLVDGLIAYAECSMLPGVDRLLIASGRVPGDAWRAAVVAGRAQERVGAELVSAGLLTVAELEAVTVLALYDAAHVLFDAALTVRFESGQRHPLGLHNPLDPRAVGNEVDRRKQALADAWPDASIDTAAVVPVRRLPGHFVSLTAVQWEVVANADRRRSPVDLARLLGRDAFTIMLEVRRLARAGLVEPGRPNPSVATESVATVRARAAVPVRTAPAAARVPVPEPPPDDAAPPPVGELPRRRVRDVPPAPSTGSEYYSEEVLVRLRSGLAAMR
ncbi:MAG TPA: ADAM 12 protein [Micromonosporaceae bacterium]|nr:ADAM 12 protein [Micromonosporaceae bacterium]